MANLNINGEIGFKAVKETGKTALIELIYPVGSIYMSVNSTSPASFIGGTWEQITNTFLIAAGSTYTAGSTGGSASATLSSSNMPSHTHSLPEHTHTLSIKLRSAKAGISNDYGYAGDHICGQTGGTLSDYATFTGGGTVGSISSTSGTSGANGSGEAFSILPPYLAVYMWKRTA